MTVLLVTKDKPNVQHVTATLLSEPIHIAGGWVEDKSAFNKEKMADESGAAEDGAAADVGSANMTEVCTNYRYARRNDPAHIPKDEEDKKDKRDQQESPMAKRPSKVQAGKRKAGGDK